MIMYRIFKQMDVRNRAYVIDSKGNKIYYGTIYQCNKFINYMMEDSKDEHEKDCRIAEWKACT